MSCGTSSTGAKPVEIAFQGDVELLVLGAGAVIGEVQRLLEQGVDVDLPPLAAAAARMRQHALDDPVGAPSVLGDLVEVAGEHPDELVGLGAPAAARRFELAPVASFSSSEQLDREIGEIVDEIERVLDLVGDAGRQLAQRGHLLGLDQIGLGRLQLEQARLRPRPAPPGFPPRPACAR